MSDGRKLTFTFQLSIPGSLFLSFKTEPNQERALANSAFPVNDARAIRVAEIMTDFRNLQHYLLSQIRVSPAAEEYYLEGYSLLRECITEAQAILQAPFASSSGNTGGNQEVEKQQLRA